MARPWMPMPLSMPINLRRVMALINTTIKIVMLATTNPMEEKAVPSMPKVAIMSLRNLGWASS